MSKLLALHYGSIATTQILKQIFHNQLLLGTGVKVEFLDIRKLDLRNLQEADSIVLIRPGYPDFLFAAKAAKRIGIFVIFFIDDDLLHLPDGLPSIPWECAVVKKCAELSDVVMSFNLNLVQRYTKYQKRKRGYVLDMPLPGQAIKWLDAVKHKKSAGHTERVKIVYAAGTGHIVEFNKYIWPILGRLDALCGEKISFTFVGICPKVDFSVFSFPVIQVNSMPLEEYRRYMREQRFDIGLAPLSDDLFSAGKYYNKYIEYTMVGTVGIYSCVEPYTLVVRDGENGFLCENTLEGWLQAISRAVNSREKRRACLQGAVEDLKLRHSEKDVKRKFAVALPELFGGVENRRKIPMGYVVKSLVFSSFFKLATRAYLWVWHFKREGFAWIRGKLIH